MTEFAQIETVQIILIDHKFILKILPDLYIYKLRFNMLQMPQEEKEGGLRRRFIDLFRKKTGIKSILLCQLSPLI